MIKNDFKTDKICIVCIHYGYCLVYLGEKCKRQGGSSIPRLKRSCVDMSLNQKTSKKYASKRSIEPIRNKSVKWDLT